MNDSFELLDPSNAQSFLKSFDLASKRLGQACFRGGRVGELIAETPGSLYLAAVNENGHVCEVELEHDNLDGWSGVCTCPKEEFCEHIFAAMSALLAEHRTATVRNLSAGILQTEPATQSAKSRQSGPVTLARKLLAALGRPLNAEETKFVRKVHTVYENCRQVGHITRWDFEQMGMRLGGYGWEALRIWPSLPADEHEFWLYVANAAQELGAKWPEFMQPITDLRPIQDRLAKWRRSCEVEKWKQTLSRLQAHGGPERLGTAQRKELCLLIGDKEALLEWKPEGEAAFRAMRASQFRDLARDYGEGLVEFTTEDELLWRSFSKKLSFGEGPHLRYSKPEDMETLRGLLRIGLLDSRIIAGDGRPLARPAEPLRWEIVPAADREDDYRFRLVQADGSAAPPVLCILTGNPTLYLTAAALFIGPQSHLNLLHLDRENRIPAPAIEQAAGVTFVQSLGLPLPPRLSERVRTLPFEVEIKCGLQPTYPGSEVEECLINILASAPDGQQQVWTGYNWLDSTIQRARKQAERRDASIIVHDRRLLQLVPRLLESLNSRPAPQGRGIVLKLTKKFPEQFAAWLKSVPPEIKVHLAGELASFANAEVAGRVKLDVTEAEIDWFDLRVVLDVADTTLSAEEVRLLLNAKGGYVRLEGKGWRRLHFDLSEDEDERLARLGLSPRELSAEPQRLHALQLADDAAKKFLPEQQVEQIQRRAGEIKARVAPNLPAAVTAQLRPYQLEGFHFLAYLSTNHFGGILADDMGLGKTLQALAWLIWLREQSPNGEGETHNGPVLVVCPKSVMDNWRAEAARFTPSLRVKAWPASELAGFRDHLADADLHVLNYSQLRVLGESLTPIRWHALILDEGQYIKNPNSQTAQIARSLRAGHRLILSGTPIENRLLDLWSLMAFAMPGILGSRAQFGRLYDTKGDPFARRRLAARVRPFLLRRTKTQVAKDLPDRIEEDLFCEIEDEQKMLYRAEFKRAQQMLLRIQTQKELAEHRFHFLTSLLRLRQICCHPRLVKPDSTAASAKSDALLEQLEPIMEEGQKVLVFSQFVQMLDLLRPLITERKWPLFYLAGETENRGELVQQFQNASGSAVFLISLKAGGFGLNLTAASYVVLFDPWWNPAVENQAIDRTHRIGQVNKVIAYRLLIKNSIEEKIRELQKKKKALVEDVLGEERFAQSLTLDDLQFLFAD